MAERPIANPTVLAVSAFAEDRRSLRRIFDHSHWKLQFTRTYPQTQTALRASSVGVVISESLLCDGHRWTDLLSEMQEMKYPPPLIVADRLADESLWAEVLNLGGFDLLAKPFEEKEVLHAVSTACRRCESERRTAALRKPGGTAEGGGARGTKARAFGGR
jgi:FixJ family two-component response regulator